MASEELIRLTEIFTVIPGYSNQRFRVPITSKLPDPFNVKSEQICDLSTWIYAKEGLENKAMNITD